MPAAPHALYARKAGDSASIEMPYSRSVSTGLNVFMVTNTGSGKGIVSLGAKNDKKLKHTPVILFTAHSDTMTAKKARKLGAGDYIIKPFDPEELANKVEQILAQGAVP